MIAKSRHQAKFGDPNSQRARVAGSGGKESGLGKHTVEMRIFKTLVITSTLSFDNPTAIAPSLPMMTGHFVLAQSTLLRKHVQKILLRTRLFRCH